MKSCHPTDYEPLFSKDYKAVSMAHGITLPKNQRKISQTMMGQYWLGKTTSVSDHFKMLSKNFNGVGKYI